MLVSVVLFLIMKLNNIHKDLRNYVFLSQIGKNTFSVGNYPNAEERKTGSKMYNYTI